MISEFSKENNLNFYYMTGGPFLVGKAENELNFIKNNVKKNDIVILTIHRTYFYDVSKRYSIRDYKGLDTKNAMERTANFRNIAKINLEKIINFIILNEAKLILIHDTPILGFDIVSACIMQKLINGYSLCKIPKELSRVHRKPMESLFSEMVMDYKQYNVFEWDPHDLFCEDKSCSYSVSKNINFFDSGHLTKNGSLFLKSSFIDFIRQYSLLEKTYN